MIDSITGLPNRISHLREDVVIDGSLTINGSVTLGNGTVLGGSPSAYSLGAASTYVILASSALTVTTSQVVTGDVGQLGAPTGALIFMSGADYPSPADSQALADATTLYNLFTGLTPTYSFLSGAVDLDTVNVGGGAGVFTPGIYAGNGAANTDASGIVTLNGAGDYVFVFNGALTTGANTIIKLTNGATANRVFWVTSAALTTGANTIFKGTSLTPAAITTGANTNLQGRIISIGAAISTGAANSLNNN